MLQNKINKNCTCTFTIALFSPVGRSVEYSARIIISTIVCYLSLMCSTTGYKLLLTHTLKHLQFTAVLLKQS